MEKVGKRIVMAIATSIKDWSDQDVDSFKPTRWIKGELRALPDYYRAWPDAFGHSYFWFRARLRELAMKSWRESGLLDVRWMPPGEMGEKLADSVYLKMDDDDFTAPFLLDELVGREVEQGRVYYWREYFTGCPNYSFYDLGIYGSRKQPHSHNQLYVRPGGKPKEAPRVFMDVRSPLTLWSPNPTSRSVFKRMLQYDWGRVEGDTRGWVPKLRLIRDVYVRKSEASLETIPRDSWFVPYWEEVLDLFRGASGVG